MGSGIRPGQERNKIMFGTLTRLTKTFHAPAAAEREFIYVAVATDRLEARQRQVARGLRSERAFGC